MGKIYAKVIQTTPIETRNKKDNSGSYQYADVTLQIADKDGQPSTHQHFDWRTGVKLSDTPDTITYDCVHDKAVALDALKLQPGEWIIADVSIERNKFSRNEVTVLSVERQPQQPQYGAQPIR